MHIYYVYAIALQGGNTTSSFVANALLSSVSRSQVYAKDCWEPIAEVLMRPQLAHVPELEPDVIPDI